MCHSLTSLRKLRILAALLLSAFAGQSFAPQAPAQTTYKSAEEAFRVGAAFLSTRNYAASQEPLEAALKLAPDDKFRLKVYAALLPAYRLLPEIDKMLEAVEFIAGKSSSPYERANTRQGLVSFLHQRGKADAVAERYEKVLATTPEDPVALYLLGEIYAGPLDKPERAAEIMEKHVKLLEKEGKTVDVATSAQLARQYVRAKKFTAGAELYEKIGPLDPKLAAWHYKDAAEAWLAADDKARALSAATASAISQPESRSEQLSYFWRRSLGDTFLRAGEPALAIPHLQQALTLTKIPGYVKDTEAKLAEAEEKAKKN